MRFVLLACLALSPALASAQTCRAQFSIEVTQGVGPITPGAVLSGVAEYTTQGRSFRQEGGATAHLATGEMLLGEDIRGPIWTLISSASITGGGAADTVGIYARHVEGLTYAGVEFTGPMALTLFGRPGTRTTPAPPATQAEWDALSLRRVFFLSAGGADMLAGDVRTLTVDCD
jgi:hypothetical protein